MKETEHDTTENPNRVLGNILKEILIPACIVVETEVDAGPAHHVPAYRVDDDGFRFEETVELKPPPISILIRSLEKDDWRPEQKQLLPDGIRDVHMTNTTLEFKHDEPITESTLAGAIGTSYFFCKAYGHDSHDILDCLVTPYDIPEFFVFQTTRGVYRSDSPLLERVRLVAWTSCQTPHGMPP